ncbi:9 TM domain-containing transmembrane protein [Acrasis kona]|uniref:9 TM domain-containing transmembrane protein n=1 Tax=Acrasis kona TaxID=1008807 RepID=A0AAW2ZQ87_9EUKA
MIVVTFLTEDGLPFDDYSTPVNLLYAVTFDYFLYIEPNMRYYTADTISKRMSFGNLTITKQTITKMAPEIDAFLNGTISTPPTVPLIFNHTKLLLATSKYGAFSLCWIKSTGLTFQKSSYSCVPFSNIESEPLDVPFPTILAYQNYVLLLFQMILAVVIASYYNYKLKLIRESYKSIYVTDSVKNPPMWQCAIPKLSVKAAAMFNIWNTIWMCGVHLVVCTLTLLSSVIGDQQWPTTSTADDAPITGLTTKGDHFYPLVACIITNTLLFVIRVTSDNMRHKMVRMDNDHTWSGRTSRIVLSFTISLAWGVLMAAYITLFIKPDHPIDLALWYTSVAVTFLIMFYKLYKTHIYMIKWFYFKLNPHRDDSQFELNDLLLTNGVAGVEEKPPRGGQYNIMFHHHFYCNLFFMFVYYMIRAIWLGTLIMMGYSTASFCARLIESTVSNIVVNSEQIATYAYVLCMVFVFYQFTLDIEQPYMKLKNLLSQNRPSLSLDQIDHNRRLARSITMDQIKQYVQMGRSPPAYHVPITWTTFITLTRMMKIDQRNLRTVGELLLTVFILNVFFTTTAVFGNTQAVQIDYSYVAVLCGFLMPMIPKAVSYISDNQITMECDIWKTRMMNSIKLLEQQEEERNRDEFELGRMPHEFMPFLFTIVGKSNHNKWKLIGPAYRDVDGEHHEKSL